MDDLTNPNLFAKLVFQMDGNDTQIQQLKQYFFIIVDTHLTTQFGSDQGKNLFREFKTQFNQLWEQNKDIMPDFLSKQHGINPIFVIALRNSLMGEELSLDELKNHVITIYTSIIAEYLKEMTTQLEKSPNPFADYVQSAIEGGKRMYDNDYFRLKTLQADEQGYHFDIQRCLYFEIFQKNNAFELGPILCEYDLIGANVVEKWVRFERPETIAEGFPCCAFRFYPK